MANIEQDGRHDLAVEIVNPRPLDYFALQTFFARKYSEIVSEPFYYSLTTKTAIFRLIFDEKPRKDKPNDEWRTLIGKSMNQNNDTDLTKIFYNAYLSQPHLYNHLSDGVNKDGNRFGPFDFFYNSINKSVTLHLISDRLSEANLVHNGIEKYRKYLGNMFDYIKIFHPDVDTASSQSWLLYKLQKFPSLFSKIFPESFLDNILDLPPKKISLTGEDIWGQFVNKNGLQKELVNKFTANISEAKTREDLINAFPLRVKYSTDKIDNFVDFYKSYASI